MNSSTCGHPRAQLANAERSICRTNALAIDRACTRVTLQNLHGKEGVDGSSPSGGFDTKSLQTGMLCCLTCRRSVRVVVPAPWGQLLVGGALLWEIAEKLFLLRYGKRMPPAIGREALIGLPVTAVSACLPEGWVKLRGERWKARCSEGAGVGDSLVVEAVEQITLIVAQPPSSPTR
jgi:hypothetical protein